MVMAGLQKRAENTRLSMAFFNRNEDEDGVPKFFSYPYIPDTIYIAPHERKGCSWYLWLFYKLLRAIYVPWFYFMPSFFFFGQYITPFLMMN